MSPLPPGDYRATFRELGAMVRQLEEGQRTGLVDGFIVLRWRSLDATSRKNLWAMCKGSMLARKGYDATLGPYGATHDG